MKARGCWFRQNFPESSRLCRGFLVPLVARRSGAAGHGSTGLEYTLTEISRSHVAADPPTIVCSVGFGTLLTERFLVPSWAPEGRYCGEVQVGDRVDVRFKGHMGDQEQMGSVRVRTRTEVRDLKSSFMVYGGVVALMLGLMSCFFSLPDHAPHSSYRGVKSLRVVRYGRTLRAV